MSYSHNSSSLRLALLLGNRLWGYSAMSYNKAVFSNIEKVSPFDVGMDDLSNVKVHGRGTTHIMPSVNGGSVKCILDVVLYVLYRILVTTSFLLV